MRQSTPSLYVSSRSAGARARHERHCARCANRPEAGARPRRARPGWRTPSWRAWRARVPAATAGGIVVDAGAVPVPARCRDPAATVRRRPAATGRVPSRPTRAVASMAPNPTARARATHPVKAKLSSGIYHVPGGANYEPHARRPLLRRRRRRRRRRPAPLQGLTPVDSCVNAQLEIDWCERVDAGGLHAGLRGDALRRRRRGTGVVGRDHHQRGLAARALADVHVRDVDARPRRGSCRPGRSRRARRRCARRACGAPAAGRPSARRCRRCAAPAACRTACADTCVPWSPRTTIEVHVVARVRRLRLAHDDAALLGESAARSRTTPARRRPAPAHPSTPTA